MRSCVLALIAALPLAGCSSTASNTINVREGDSDMLVGNPSLLSDLGLDKVVTRRKQDRLEFQAEMVNKTSSDVRFQWRIEWFDRDGFRLDNPVPSYQPVVLNGKGIYPIQAIAVSPAAIRARVHVERPNEVRE